MTPQTIKQGLVIGGRYVLLSRIAIGGMGEVWRARDILEHQMVAVKVLKVELSGQEQYLARLRLEAANAQRINHPNLAAVLNSGEDEGLGWLAMELVEGEPLSERIAGGQILSPQQALPIIYGTALALDAAHQAGVVHRDIKPGNILLTAEGQVKLTDFGISKTDSQESLTQAGMVMGTAQYLPPEQAVGEAATAAGDLYALGVIFYEILAGKRPFTGKSQVDIAFAHVNSPVPPLPTSIPAPLRELVEQLLEKDPELRINSAAELARRLEEVDAQLGLDCLVPVGHAAKTDPRPRPRHFAAAATVNGVPLPPPPVPRTTTQDTPAAEPVAHTAPITQLGGGTVPAPEVMPPAYQPRGHAGATETPDPEFAAQFPQAPPPPQQVELSPGASSHTPAQLPPEPPHFEEVGDYAEAVADTFAAVADAVEEVTDAAAAAEQVEAAAQDWEQPADTSAADSVEETHAVAAPSPVSLPPRPAPVAAVPEDIVAGTTQNTGKMLQKLRLWLFEVPQPAQHLRPILAYMTPLFVIAAAIVIITIALMIATLTAPGTVQAEALSDSLIQAGGTISCHKLF